MSVASGTGADAAEASPTAANETVGVACVVVAEKTTDLGIVADEAVEGDSTVLSGDAVAVAVACSTVVPPGLVLSRSHAARIPRTDVRRQGTYGIR
jgi:hypothetical protein